MQSGKESGYIDQVDVNSLKVIEKNINEARWDVVKLALKAQLNKDWSVTPALFYQRYKSDDIDAAYRAVGDYQSANAGVVLPQFQTSKIVREPGTDTLTVPSVTVAGDLGFADVTVYAISATGARVRLGQVNGNSTQRLALPAYLVRGGERLRFLADPIGGSQGPVSEELYVAPGEAVTLTIPPR